MKIKYMLLAWMPLCLASCSEEENIVSDKSYQEVRVTAGAGADSRIVLNDEGDRITSLWQDGDKIFLFTSTRTGLEYNTHLDGNVAMTEFTPANEALEAIEGNTVYACYPGFSSVESSGMTVGLIPTDVIDYNHGTIPSFGYAVGTISDGGVDFRFKHIAAFLYLKVTPKMLADPTKGICSIRVSTTSDAPLSVGEGDTFDFSTLTANTTNGSNTVQVNVDNQVVESEWTAYVPILPQPADAHITITLADSEGSELYTTVKQAPETGFLAGYVYKHVPEMAYLIDGPTFNSRIRELTRSGSSYGNNENIGKIEFVTEIKTLPEEYVVVSADDSPAPVYASFNTGDSLLTVFTPAKDIDMVDASELFKGFLSLHTIDWGTLDVNETTISTAKMFATCPALTSLDVSDWDVSNVTDMSSMFDGCRGLTSLDVSGWDVSNVTSMEAMFWYCEVLTSLDVSDWDVSNVTNMSSMFRYCSGLTSLDVSGWDTANVTGMFGVFANCTSLSFLDVSGWDTANVTDMSGIFAYCTSLPSLNISGWDTGNVMNMSSMFSGCSFPSLDISGWDTGNVMNMSSMFSGCSLPSLDISGWDTSNVMNMSSMFSSCSLTSLDISGWNTGNVMSMSSMFMGCSLSSLDISAWNTEHVMRMDNMFADCSSLTSLDVAGWNTGNVVELNAVFSGCSSLSSLDVSGWNTGSVTKMNGVFADCSSLASLDVSGWDTRNVIEMVSVFSSCTSLSSLDVSGWDTENVTKMSGVFYECSALTSLDVSGWDTSNVVDVNSLFCKCSALTSLNMTHWDFQDNVSVSYMFIDCAFTSQACEIIASDEMKQLLLNKKETTGMISDWFTWKNEGTLYEDMNNHYW